MRSFGLIAGGIAVLLSNAVFGATDCAGNCEAKMVTDFSGKPPFKRRVELVPVVDIAQVEIVTSEPEYVAVKTVDYKGKPPFKRRVELLEKTDIMQAELVEEADGADEPRKKGTGNSMFKRR